MQMSGSLSLSSLSRAPRVDALGSERLVLRKMLSALSLVRAHTLSAPAGTFDASSTSRLLRALSAAHLLGTPLLQRLSTEVGLLPAVPGALSPRRAIDLFAALARVPNKLDRVMAKGQALPLLSRSVRASPPGHLRPRDLARLLGAVTRRRYFSDGALFRFVSGEVTRLPVSAFSVREIAVIVDSFAKAGVWDEKFAVIVDSFAKAGVWDEKVFRHLSVSARQLRWENLELRDAAQICGAFSNNGSNVQGSNLRDGALFRHVSVSLTSKGLHCTGCCSRPIAEILNAFARSSVWDDRLFSRLSQMAQELHPAEVPATNMAAILVVG
ncbi:hypothetical protein T484DRAFT_1791225 [Baffinella frigidus]|nr:hypothetical protein T484DRAFT_1791225 [Cryptophyta sp. CCMP2293]